MSNNEEIKRYRTLAEAGDAVAQSWLGWAYLNGNGVPQDDAEAVKWYRKAAEQGNAYAQNNLGWMYQTGKGVPQSDAEAVKWYCEAAEQGHADAQTNLGWMYQKGKGVPQSDAEAVKWYRKAAEQGNAYAQNNLGSIYQNGKVVPQDDAEAVKCYRKAAEQGLAAAQNNLGAMYQNGKGVPQDDAEAVKWYRKAAEQGHAEAMKWFLKAAEQGNADAQFWLGWMYQNGKGVPQDDAEAVKWYRKVAEQGYADGQYRLGRMYRLGKGVPRDYTEAAKWYLMAAEQGHADAQHRLGLMYESGVGVPQNDEEAVKWYRKAAEQGDATAQMRLGSMYKDGKGIRQDDAKAVKWFLKAAEQGNADAQNWLGWMYQNGKGVQQDDSEAVKWYSKAAEQGNADAKKNLDRMSPISKSVQQDDTEDVKRYREAAEQGDAEAQFNLGWMYRNGKGVPQSDTEAVKWYRKAAEEGHATAQNNLGVMYQNGKGVQQDHAEAVKWFRKAAEGGIAIAQFNLGRMYRNGEGIPQSDTEAVKWYRKAAEEGHATAQNNLGVMYQDGKGVPQDYAEAMKWYGKAAEQGNADAQFNLGVIYQDGKGVPQDYAEAVRWYSKAAEQGNADAQNKLDQMKAKSIKIDEGESQPLSEQKIGVTTSTSKNKKSSALDRRLRDAKECKPLLDACTPRLYRDNAFRISGIPVDASTRDIKRRMDDLKAAAEMGDLKNELIHAFTLDPVPGLDQLRTASQKLQDPEHRIIDEFFWFWPYEWGKSDIDPALTALINCDKGTAIKIWSEALSDNHTLKSTAAKHNLAVMYHIVALDSEQNALKNDLSAEQFVTLSRDWRTCLKYWEELVNNETLWSLFADRIRKVDDPRLTTGFAHRLRATLPEAIGKINAMLAIDFAEYGKSSLVVNHINYMKETHQGENNFSKTLSIVAKPLKVRVTSAVEKAIFIVENNPAQAHKEALELLQAISEPLKVIQTILPPEDHERIDLCDTVAEACLTCQIAYARESEDWTTSLEILDAASKYAASKETSDRISKKRSTVATAQHIDPLLKKIKEIEELNFSIADKMSDIKTDLLPYLSNIKKFPGMSDDIYEKCADAVAHYIRELSIAEYNENNDFKGALLILDVSISVARGHEVREQLQEDKAKLINIQKETTKHNLQIQIRRDEIEVTSEFVRYNDQKIPVSRIQGIKYGVFIQVINGIRTSSYSIGITGGQSGAIHIECKRFFRNETQAEVDFDRILEALYHQVVPALVQNLTEGILSGRLLQIGNCRLTREGMYITTGSLLWKKETLVPFSDLRFSKSAGQINVSSVKQAWIGASMAIRDIWNATLLEFITKAVVEMKEKR